jgi:NADPH:quinone reductase-like Zn-dependent oxidoreductase
MAQLPDQMTAIEISTPGGPEVLVASRRPLPVPDVGEVLL